MGASIGNEPQVKQFSGVPIRRRLKNVGMLFPEDG